MNAGIYPNSSERTVSLGDELFLDGDGYMFTAYVTRKDLKKLRKAITEYLKENK